MIPRSILVVCVLMLLGAPVAEADTSTSSNWSGYVAHGGGARFRYVTALWTQPTPSCSAGDPTYSAVWVGIGGYSLTSSALEQVGTEADCAASGRGVSTAWYELVPAPSRGIRMSVHSGDVMAGSVTVIGHRVTLTLTDRTRHKSFSKNVTQSSVDVSSADWIVEAPSVCSATGSDCNALPLADFGSETFARAKAETISGQVGSIVSRLWRTTEITLAPDARRFVASGGSTEGESSPSSLMASGSSFKLTYSPVALPITGPLPYESKLASAARATSVPAVLQPGGARH